MDSVSATPRVDAHVHLWGHDTVRYPFGPHDGIPAPQEPFPAERLDAAMRAAGVSQAIAIQPRVYGYDHAYLLAAAAELGDRLRVMPLINVARPSCVDEMEGLADHASVVGFRVNVLGERQATALLASTAAQLWRRLSGRDLPVGLLVEPEHLPVVETFAAGYPTLRIVLDHLGGIRADDWPQRGQVLLRLSRLHNVYIKLSALGHLSGRPFPHGDLHSAVRQLLVSYGPRRLLWGSDWPHAYGYGTYADSHRSVEAALATAAGADTEQVFAGTARSLFGLSEPDPR